MKRSPTILRGAKGYGWYNNFAETGTPIKKSYVPPTTFNWTSSDDKNILRSHAFFDVRIDQEKLGRLKFELAGDVTPLTVNNFKELCLGKGTKYGGYKNTKIHYIQKAVCIMGGDVENTLDGQGNHSATNIRYFKDENYIIPHTARGLIRFVKNFSYNNMHICI